jgi:predicted peptidase
LPYGIWAKFGWTNFALVFLLASALAPLCRSGQLNQDDINFRKKVYTQKKTTESLSYRLFVPLGYDANRRYPLLLWLHSAEGRGSDNFKQLTGVNSLGTHFWIADSVQLKVPMFVMVPQLPSGQNWSDPEFNQPSTWLALTNEALTKGVEKEFSIDPDRIYVAGQSMGGLGAWSALQAYPGQFAAAIIISTYDTFTDLPALSKTPIWIFQGEADTMVPVLIVREMVKQLKKAHANFRYTEYPRAGHDVWTKAFAEPDLLTWLTAQQRPAATPAASQLGSSAPQK